MKIRVNYYLACLVILHIFIPTIRWKILYLTIVFAISMISNKSINKDIIKIGKFRTIYAVTFIGSYFIHYYSGSLNGIIYFISSFFIVRYIVIKGLKKNSDVEKIIDYILILFIVYAVLGVIESITPNRFNIFDVVFDRNIIIGGANTYRGFFFRNHGLCTVSINNALIVFMVWILSSYKVFKYGHVLHYISFIMLGIDLIMIFSRGVLLVAVVMFLLLYRKAKANKKLIFAVVAIFMMALFLGMQNDIESFWKIFSEQFYPLVEEFLKGGYKTSGGISAGSGHRFALFGWVFSTIKKDLLFGVGFVKEFAYKYTFSGNIHEKHSIEIQWLYVLYQKGIWGLTGFILYEISCVKLVFSSLKKEKKTTLNLSMTYMYITVGYFIGLFDCAAFDDLLVFYMLISVFEAYRNNLIKEKGNRLGPCRL